MEIEIFCETYIWFLPSFRRYTGICLYVKNISVTGFINLIQQLQFASHNDNNSGINNSSNKEFKNDNNQKNNNLQLQPQLLT